MSTTRLTFLYPHLFRSIRCSEPIPTILRTSQQALQRQCRGFATTAPRRERLVERHGKAVEPFLPEGESADSAKVFTPEEISKAGAKSKNKHASKKESKPEISSAAPLSSETVAAMELPSDKGAEEKPIPETEKTPLQQAAANTMDKKAPLETVLHMPPPETEEEKNASKPPHLQTPPYVHHFDTYTLVKQVQEGGFTEQQSITAMKAVRGLLTQNLEVARRGLVSKSDVENESYLFRAACSELKTEIQNTRRANEETMRRDRTLLQHEMDILNQKLSQELMKLRDELKGMFDDRKMDVRTQQRVMESAIQELNYEITVSLNSDSKSEVEGVRWVLTRRSVIAILFMALMVLCSLRYASYKSHEEDVRKKKMKKEGEASAKNEHGHERGKHEHEMVPVADLPAQGAAEILAAN